MDDGNRHEHEKTNEGAKIFVIIMVLVMSGMIVWALAIKELKDIIYGEDRPGLIRLFNEHCEVHSFTIDCTGTKRPDTMEQTNE